MYSGYCVLNNRNNMNSIQVYYEITPQLVTEIEWGLLGVTAARYPGKLKVRVQIPE